MKPEYNILKTAASSLGFKHSIDTFEVIKNHTVSADTKHNLSLAASKRIYSDKEKFSIARLGKKLTSAIRSKISNTTTKLRGKKVLVNDIQSNEVQEFISLTAVAHSLIVSRTAVSKCLTKGKRLKNRWHIYYTSV